MRSGSLMDFIVASISQALDEPHAGGLTAREVYLRGCECYEHAQFAKHLEAQRRALEKDLPLLNRSGGQFSPAESDQL
jgi:hypothetical protein